MKGKVLVVSGTRRILDEDEISRKVAPFLERALKDAVVVHVGDCPTGIDWIVGAMVHSVPVRVHEAYWDEEGHRAGPERNRRMLTAAQEQAGRLHLPVLLTAFPNGLKHEESPGTWSTIKIANEMRVPVEITPV